MLIVASGPDQSDELSMLDSDNANISPDSLKSRRIDHTIRVFQSLGA